MLRVLIAKDGRVAEVHIDRSVPMLDDAAVEAARKWVFKPALANNRPIAVWIVRTVRFTLSTARL
jgi:protein TonB